ncbi:MAG: DUF4177 domain-containing protein [Phaeovulum sp.]|uniref:DUF4177 domain-containing protein n=1 Tax=Phaeovulum sp. TaxID=2934796 RepID=UPI00272F9921|nr:DUF4177 domain-containing protein [Phaeovulum sp.]MDP2061872.1 DUF4177 domain-containing protein [Phaeovulum sp.]
MQSYEYTAIPAPLRAEKNRALKTPGERFGATLAAELNRMAADGWEYLRADVLPSEERSGLTGRSTVYHNLLIFRRAIVTEAETVLLPAAEQLPDLREPAPESVPTFLASTTPGLAPRLSAHSDPGSAPRLGPATPES